jgi:hypothetical protein
MAACLMSAPAAAQTNLFGFDIDYQLQGTALFALRLDEQDQRLINAPPAESIPLPDYLKLPESHNFDDGNRNFERWAPVNSRAGFLGEVQIERRNYGAVLRGDAFYDYIYRTSNDNDSPESISKTEGPVNEFTPEAMRFSGRRARLLDAYVYGDWSFDNGMSMNLRVGQHVAAWGESLFFSGVALAQLPADATRANLAGADVKSILLPVNQISTRIGLNEQFTLLGQYKLEHAPVEVNPVGEYFSLVDIVGPGAEFIYGIRNPFFLENLGEPNLLSSDLPESLQLIVDLIAPDLPTEDATDLLITAFDNLEPFLPEANLPVPATEQDNAPRNINVQRAEDINPSDYGQWGLGLMYQITPATTLGFYRLRYHNTVPAPVQNYGFATLLEAPDGSPLITTEDLGGLEVPVTYNIKYFDGIDLSAVSFSTTLFGVNVAGEVLYREGIDVLVDVDGGLLGPVPTPSRSNTFQALLSGLYLDAPRFFWDQLVLIGELGYINVVNTGEACGPTSCSRQLSNDKEAYGFSMLAFADVRNIFPGWDLQIPVNLAAGLHGSSSQSAALGAITGEGDLRAGIGFNFTYLGRLTLGTTVSGFFGGGDLRKRPLSDRSNIAFTARYAFF